MPKRTIYRIYLGRIAVRVGIAKHLRKEGRQRYQSRSIEISGTWLLHRDETSDAMIHTRHAIDSIEISSTVGDVASSSIFCNYPVSVFILHRHVLRGEIPLK